MENINEILTLAEIADYLKLSEKTILRMIQRKEIPCAKIANQWRFSRSLINDWIQSRMQVIPHNDLSRLIVMESDLFPLSRLIKEEHIILNLVPGTKETVLQQLIDHLDHGFSKVDKDWLLKKLLEREKLTSTAIGNGVAIPHLRKPQESTIPGPIILAGICSEGTDFNSIDNQVTKLFFLVITDSEIVHLKIMAKLTRLLRDQTIIEKIVQAVDKSSIVGLLIEKENIILN